ncbi:hypothetical protein BS47DRAFT_1354703 [Hydnum rufescens UP504]|uniref:Uncharacterized protein n=1 Tax=Hydnum rufescens UP504 TaxID=1448309 RepID=A0A9P6AGC2_9AGAM|nr:hypothetical protein BS47DRAFT_1354703 [Hydnum rufescens UP504]
MFGSRSRTGVQGVTSHTKECDPLRNRHLMTRVYLVTNIGMEYKGDYYRRPGLRVAPTATAPTSRVAGPSQGGDLKTTSIYGPRGSRAPATLY